MLKALILSYHFPPMNVIGSYRAQAYADHMSENGISPTVITHDWEAFYKNEKGRQTTEEFESYKVIRLPIKNWKEGDKLEKSQQGKTGKWGILKAWRKGHLDTSAFHYNSYLTYKSFLANFLKKETFDVVIGIASPHHQHRLAYEIYQTHNIPYILDYRDLWNNRIISLKYQPNLTEKIQDYYCSKFWKKWNKHALFNSITSLPWLNKLEDITGKKGIVVKNGFEIEKFEKLHHSPSSNFELVHNGSMYRHQRIDLFLNGVSLFIKKRNPKNLRISFYGAKRKIYQKSYNSFTDNPEELFNQYISQEYYQLTERIPREDSLKHLKNADLIIFPTFPDTPGTYAGKIFEYLGSRREILAFPNDHGVIKDLLETTQSGTILDTPEQIAVFIESKYDMWLNNNHIPDTGNWDEVYKFSRKYQTELLCTEIKKRLSN